MVKGRKKLLLLLLCLLSTKGVTCLLSTKGVTRTHRHCAGNDGPCGQFVLYCRIVFNSTGQLSRGCDDYKENFCALPMMLHSNDSCHVRDENGDYDIDKTEKNGPDHKIVVCCCDKDKCNSEGNDLLDAGLYYTGIVATCYGREAPILDEKCQKNRADRSNIVCSVTYDVATGEEEAECGCITQKINGCELALKKTEFSDERKVMVCCCKGSGCNRNWHKFENGMMNARHTYLQMTTTTSATTTTTITTTRATAATTTAVMTTMVTTQSRATTAATKSAATATTKTTTTATTTTTVTTVTTSVAGKGVNTSMGTRTTPTNVTVTSRTTKTTTATSRISTSSQPTTVTSQHSTEVLISSMMAMMTNSTTSRAPPQMTPANATSTSTATRASTLSGPTTVTSRCSTKVLLNLMTASSRNRTDATMPFDAGDVTMMKESQASAAKKLPLWMAPLILILPPTIGVLLWLMFLSAVQTRGLARWMAVEKQTKLANLPLPLEIDPMAKPVDLDYDDE